MYQTDGLDVYIQELVLKKKSWGLFLLKKNPFFYYFLLFPLIFLLYKLYINWYEILAPCLKLNFQKYLLFHCDQLLPSWEPTYNAPFWPQKAKNCHFCPNWLRGLFGPPHGWCHRKICLTMLGPTSHQLDATKMSKKLKEREKTKKWPKKVAFFQKAPRIFFQNQFLNVHIEPDRLAYQNLSGQMYPP